MGASLIASNVIRFNTQRTLMILLLWGKTNLICPLIQQVSLLDAAYSKQINFQRPATQNMENLVELHHDIFSVLLFLCLFVFYMLFITVFLFRSTSGHGRNFHFKSHTLMEII